jgi:ubiquitin-small subunit ribosomal protein S27Ae
MVKDVKGGAGGTKRKKKNKPSSKKYKMFKIHGNTITRERSCPRCGLGVFLLKANNRVYCGRCHYTEFFKQVK